MLDGFFDVTFGYLINWSKLGGLLIICFLLTLITTLVYKFMTNQSLMKDLKDEMKQVQKDMKDLKSDPAKMVEAQKKAWDKNMKYMMHSFKPMIITFIPIILIFGWLSKNLGDTVFFGLKWLWVYIIASIVFSMGLRKVLKVH